MLIDETTILSAVNNGLKAIACNDFKTHQHPCPHCGCSVRYPIIARRQDIDDFNSLMQSAYRIMEKYGITANLLAEIIANAHIAKAKKPTDT